ncbi:MAG TPA: sensor histidine kinase KdpD [Bacteroidota bacterium]|nr:sensor histidine kinase KdpD [Bacteroidota bacterium]
MNIAHSDHERPDPDALLQRINREAEKERKGKLKIFLGMCAGTGKTYEMLKAAHELVNKQIDVVIGYVETHGRRETEALATGLPLIPRKRQEYRGAPLEEMDLDAIIARRPTVVLVDELAHTNAPGSRHTKRYNDVIELLDNGIDVYTALNIQHLESRADTVAQITGTAIRETVPDSIVEMADEVELIDISPEELLKRLAEGKVYTSDRSQAAVQNFFRKGNLTALREMALRLTAERVDQQLRDYMQTEQIAGPWKSGQRLMVAISSNPHSEELIRWARRMSYSMGASWIVVYVETSAALDGASRDQLARNIKLARELGAEVISTSDENIVSALLRVARQHNISQLIIGKSGGRRFLWKKNLLDDLIAHSGGIDIYVVGADTQSARPMRLFSIPETHSGIGQYALAAGIIIAVVTFCAVFLGGVSYHGIAMVLLLTVSAMPLMFSSGPVITAALLSALCWDFFFIPPKYTMWIALLEDRLMLLTYFSVATVTSVLSTRIRAQEKAVRQREDRAIALYGLTKELAAAQTRDEVMRVSIVNVKKYFSADVIAFLSDADGEISPTPHIASTFAIDQKEFSVAAWTYWNEKKAGAGTETLPFAQATYFPLSGPRYPLGVIGVRMDKEIKLSIDQEVFLDNFIRQIASAMEREFLNEMAKESIAVEESQKLYKTLFNSISHELRTPITSIMTAAENLQNEKLAADEMTRRELSGEIHLAAERLNRIAENLLDMTRIESGLIRPNIDWCDIHDVVNTALARLSTELSRHRVEVSIPQTLPLVKLDSGLIEQVLINLLFNASVYTPAGSRITINACIDSNDLEFVVADNGPGFPVASIPLLFEKFYRIPGTKTGGTGLGLSIAKGFIEAHKGTIEAANLSPSGASFTIRIPSIIQQQSDRERTP